MARLWHAGQWTRFCEMQFKLFIYFLAFFWPFAEEPACEVFYAPMAMVTLTMREINLQPGRSKVEFLK
jgi:hypothetical protein